MTRIEHGGHVFEVYGGDPIEVTSMRRPDTWWHFVDAAGHTHAWHTGGIVASGYNPQLRYETPTLRRVVDGIGYYPDGDEYEIAHLECIRCGERVQPGFKADDTPQYIPGIRQFFVDGRPVSEQEASTIAERVGLI